MEHLRYPNESAEYRAARNALLDDEIALRAQIEAVAAKRRAYVSGRLSPPLQSLVKLWRFLFAPPHAPSEPDPRLFAAPEYRAGARLRIATGASQVKTGKKG